MRLDSADITLVSASDRAIVELKKYKYFKKGCAGYHKIPGAAFVLFNINRNTLNIMLIQSTLTQI